MSNKREPFLDKTYTKLENIPNSDFSHKEGIIYKKNSNHVDYYHEAELYEKLWFSWVNNILKVIFCLHIPESQDY